MHAVIFSLTQFLILLLEQRRVQVQALPQRVPGVPYLEVWALSEGRWGQPEREKSRGQVSSNSCPSLFTYNEKEEGTEGVHLK